MSRSKCRFQVYPASFGHFERTTKTEMISIQSSESQISSVSSCVPDQWYYSLSKTAPSADLLIDARVVTHAHSSSLVRSPKVLNCAIWISVGREFCFRGKENMWMTKRLQPYHALSKNVFLSLFLTSYLPLQETTTKQWVCFLRVEMGETSCVASTKIESHCLKEITLTKPSG